MFCMLNILHAQDSRSISFDKDWLFKKDSTIFASSPNYDDTGWRKLNLPHDWSIEDLPNQKEGSIMGPFTKSAVGKNMTAYSEGGVGWYRKKFTLDKNYKNKQVYINFDGVYRYSKVWVNGHYLGFHPDGYTSFFYDVTKFLKPVGEENVIAIQVDNTGNNARWYSGSGIYRHVWLTAVNKVHSNIWGNSITTPLVTEKSAQVKVETNMSNTSNFKKRVTLKIDILDPTGKVVSTTNKNIVIPPQNAYTIIQQLNVENPALWNISTPVLYTAKTMILSKGEKLDETLTYFGIRSIEFDGSRGFLLNGEMVKLKGGCIHHDHGPLGAASIDRAEVRKVELLKALGYNAVRLSHNTMAPALLKACDSLGMLVITDFFDSWERQKVADGNHVYFKEWWKKDVTSMILRDYNHPSIIMWGIGNEIFEAADTSGYRIVKELTEHIRSLDHSRPITEAIIYQPEFLKYSWEQYEPHLAYLDVDGYNYFIGNKNELHQMDSATTHRYETEHIKHPNKTFMATEYNPNAALENWDITEKLPYVIGGFKWIAMDYLGAPGAGVSQIVPIETKESKGFEGMMMFFQKESWPMFTSNCGDLDIIGNRKPASYFQDVVWRNSPIEMLVRNPLPEGMKELKAPFAFPQELKSWTFPGHEGKKIIIDVYSRSKTVKLELNRKIIAEQNIPQGSVTATFEIEYQSGVLIAKGFNDDMLMGSSVLSTTGEPWSIRLTADRKTINADPNDLAYIKVEIMDQEGNIVPYVNDLDVSYELVGNALIAAVGNGNPSDMSSFQNKHKKVYEGKGLVILRPTEYIGEIVLKAKANGVGEAIINLKSN